MENFLKQKLQQDYLDCVAVDKAILMGTIRKEEGTLILFDLLDYVKSDIATMDKTSWEILLKAEGQILEENEKRKDLLFKDRRVRDSSEKRELELSMLREDYQSCKAMLYFIQNLAYTQGWFS
jgi:hypothetical protein